MRVTEYGLKWELDPDERKGQLGLLRENHYRMLFDPVNRDASFKTDDIWMDIGANIGAFAVRAAGYVKQVVAFEPEPNCMDSLLKNARLNGVANIWTLEYAVVGSHIPQVSLALSNSYSSTHRVGTIRGRQSIIVPAVNINDVVKDSNANKLKIDCEGTEGEILLALDLKPVEEIVFEYHFSMLKDTTWFQFYRILQRLELEGFTLLKKPARKSNTWHTIVWAKRL